MALGKQAKTLTDKQVKVVLHHIAETKDPVRNKVIFLLGLDAALRAKEIAAVEWRMVCDANGVLTDELRLEDKSAKGKSGGVIYLSSRLQDALAELKEVSPTTGTIIKTRAGKSFSAATMTNWFFHLYQDLGFEGCSSHSTRRTAITRWARTISQHGGSMRDVQQLARHSSLQQTQKYVEVYEGAMKRVVG